VVSSLKQELLSGEAEATTAAAARRVMDERIYSERKCKVQCKKARRPRSAFYMKTVTAAPTLPFFRTCS
jgi:hypothetical protein